MVVTPLLHQELPVDLPISRSTQDVTDPGARASGRGRRRLAAAERRAPGARPVGDGAALAVRATRGTHHLPAGGPPPVVCRRRRLDGRLPRGRRRAHRRDHAKGAGGGASTAVSSRVPDIVHSNQRRPIPRSSRADAIDAAREPGYRRQRTSTVFVAADRITGRARAAYPHRDSSSASFEAANFTRPVVACSRICN